MKQYWVPSTFSSALFGTNITDYWFPVAQGGDIAFLYGVLKILLTNGWYDRAFVEGHTEGFEELRARRGADLVQLEMAAGLTA
jgi:anaerobic selenocysteine-containing dehydrogenase